MVGNPLSTFMVGKKGTEIFHVMQYMALTEMGLNIYHNCTRIVRATFDSKCVCNLDCKYTHIHDAVNQLSSFCKCDQKTISDITLGKTGRFHGWD